MTRFALACCLVLSIGSPAFAQDAQRINVDLDGVDLANVMDQIGRVSGQNILVDPAVDEVVRVALRDIPWREAVDVIARMTQCEFEERELILDL